MRVIGGVTTDVSMTAAAEKELYEALSAIAERGDEHADHLANTLAALLGLRWQVSRGVGMWVRDSDRQVDAERVARRWMTDGGYMKVVRM